MGAQLVQCTHLSLVVYPLLSKMFKYPNFGLFIVQHRGTLKLSLNTYLTLVNFVRIHYQNLLGRASKGGGSVTRVPRVSTWLSGYYCCQRDNYSPSASKLLESSPALYKLDH